jgi:hypothetical protein
MKSEVIASHRTLFSILIGLFDILSVISVLTLWTVDPRKLSPLSDAAGVTGVFSLIGLVVLWWLLRRGAPRLASVCLLSALVGLVCSMILPAIP